MPELPEVETVKRGLNKNIKGGRIVRIQLRRKTLRYPMPVGFAKLHNNAKVVEVKRRAKYILVELDNGYTIIIHLGMSGSMGVVGKDERQKYERHDHVIFHLDCGSKGGKLAIYNDPRRFGFMGQTKTDEVDKHKFFKNVGIEPLSKKLNGKFLAQKFEGKKTSIKAVLLDQSIVAGLGNIYVCEALWRSGVSPLREAKSVSGKKMLEKLCGHIVDVLKDAIKAGGASLKDHKNTEGKPGYFQHQFCVYDRYDQPCLKNKCNGTIQRIVQSGRSSYFCSKCQK